MADQTDDAAVEPDRFVIVDDTAERESETAEHASPAEESPALNATRVHQLSALRRGTYRARSYCFVAIGVCGVAVAQLVMMTVRHVRAAGWELRPVGYLCGTLAAAMAGAFFLRRAAELTRELRPRRGELEIEREPEIPPDFSTLSDGSHAWKNLEQMRDGP